MSTGIVKRGGVTPTAPSSSSSTNSSCGQCPPLYEYTQRNEKEEEGTKEEDEEEPEEWMCRLHCEESLQQRLGQALRERDEQWMKHEKAQIAFLQKESAGMLRGLHAEVDRLSHRLRESRRLLDIGHCSSEAEMAERLKEREAHIAELEEALHEKETRLGEIEKKVTKTVERMSEQITLQADRIRQLNSELHDRTQTVAQLSSQLRSFRLKEAMVLAQQRRRVSNASINSTSPLVSPSSPHRSFPPFSARTPSRCSSELGTEPTTQSSVFPLHDPSSSNNIDNKPRAFLRSSTRRPRSNSAVGPQAN